MEFEVRDAAFANVGVQHFHIYIGPDEVNLYNLPGFDYAGPYYSIELDDAEQAGVKWIEIVNSLVEGYFNEEDYDDVVDDVIMHAEELVLSFTAAGGGHIITLEECWGCVPSHSN